MVNASISLTAETGFTWEPLRVERGSVLGHLRVRTHQGDALIYGTPEQVRKLAAAATLAAEQADDLLRLEGLLADADMLQRAEG
jgi:hypothetical protein